jgi:carbon storage regulator
MEATMLVLSRQRDESIEIDGGRIIVTVVDIRGDKVRLGVKAAKDIPVHRAEVADELRREQPKPPQIDVAYRSTELAPTANAVAADLTSKIEASTKRKE